MSLDDFNLEEKYKDKIFETYTATKKESNELFTIKKINKEKADKRVLDLFKQGMDILNNIDHPNIIKLKEYREDAKSYIYICEYCSDKTLVDYLKERKEPLSEKEVQFIMKQVVSAIKCLHDNKIVHRDIKLDNLYIKYNSEEDLAKKNILNSKIILAGFEMSTYVKENNEYLDFVAGTPLFMAPELRKKPTKYNEKIDIWSLGVCCFKLLYGKFPFPIKDMKLDYNNRIKFDLKNPLSKEANSFIDCMLEIDPIKRISALDLSKHEFLTKKFEA